MEAAIVIPSLNEGEWLERTVKSIRENEDPNLHILHINDASEKEEPNLLKWDVKQVTNKVRLGAARARAVGMLTAYETWPDIKGIMTLDGHQLYGSGDALAALVEEGQRFQNFDGHERHPTPWECQVHLFPKKITTLLQTAIDYDCITYMGPCRMGPSTIRWQDELLRVGYLSGGDFPRTEKICNDNPLLETAAINGGNYAFSLNAFDKIGGYPQLLGLFGFEEETISLLATALKIPMICLTGASPWHLFRSQGVDPIPRPYTTSEAGELANLASVYRLCFSESMWQSRWRNVLKTKTLYGRNHTVPEGVLQSVESKEFTAYRDSLQQDFILQDEQLLAELKRKQDIDQHRLEE